MNFLKLNFYKTIKNRTIKHRTEKNKTAKNILAVPIVLLSSLLLMWNPYRTEALAVSQSSVYQADVPQSTISLPIIVAEAENGTFQWGYFTLPPEIPAEVQARLAFEYFFRYGTYGVPEGVIVLDVSQREGHLTLNVSDAILAYGGSANEYALTSQLIKLAQVISADDRSSSINRFSLKIEGQIQPLVKGTEINRVRLR